MTVLVRVAILSDTHGWVDPRIVEIVAGCDLAVHGGDIGSAAVLDQLRPRQGAACAVRGNNDRPSKWPQSDHHLLADLPHLLEVQLPGGTLAVVHGHQTGARERHALLRRRFPEARAVVYGHSHRLVLDQDEIPWIINPGAAGRSRTFGGPSCLVLSADCADWRLEIVRFAPRRCPFQRLRITSGRTV